MKCLSRDISLIVFLLVAFPLQHSIGPEQIGHDQIMQIGSQELSRSLKLSPDYGKIPLYFIPNEGQVDERGLFYAKAAGYTLWLTKEGLFFDSTRTIKNSNIELKISHLPDLNGQKDAVCERDVSRLLFQNSNENPRVIPIDFTDHKVNYFAGNDKAKWYSNIHTSRAVLYQELYKNIDLKVYGVESQIEYDFIVRPEGEVSNICFKYKDVKRTGIDKYGNLVVETKVGEIKHAKPVCYQVIEGNKIEIEAKFRKVANDAYGFAVREYNKAFELIIDPLIFFYYSTYLGGSKNDYGHDLAVDTAGSVYIIGETDSPNFPTRNYFQSYQGGRTDIFVSKINPSGGDLVYSTYLGGSGWDYGNGIAVDSEGQTYVTGSTWSTNFPICKPIKAINRSWNAFITKLNSSGNAFVYSTFLGGTAVGFGFGVAVDSEGEAYVTGNTWAKNFPIKNSFQGKNAGKHDVFITKIGSSEGIRVVSWNILNYPELNGEDREAYFQSILKVLSPDILVVQEMTTSSGVNQFLKNVLKPISKKYRAAPFYDGPGTDNALFYLRSKLKLEFQQQIPAYSRDISEFSLLVRKEPGKGSKLKIYSVHFAEGMGASEIKQRENEATVLRTYLDGLQIESLFLACGSFNMTDSNENAYKILTEDRLNITGKLIDPLGISGKWHDVKSMCDLHTESTRKIKLGSGTSGGLDDRYDMILISNGLNQDGRLFYQSGNCAVFGNDGEHLNKAINKPENKIVGPELAEGLYNASDHLPVIIDLLLQSNPSEEKGIR